MTRKPVLHWLFDATREPSSDPDILEYWDAVVRGEPLSIAAVDPTVATIIQRVHDLDDTPLPDAAFAARLERTLLRDDLPAPAPPVTSAPNPQRPSLDIAAVPVSQPTATRQHAMLHLAEMAALLAIVLASVVVTLCVGPLASRERVDAPLVLAPGITAKRACCTRASRAFPMGSWQPRSIVGSCNQGQRWSWGARSPAARDHRPT